MERSTVTALARGMGGKVVDRGDHSYVVYGFPSEKTLLEFRKKIPFLTVWTNCLDGYENLTVFLGELREECTCKNHKKVEPAKRRAKK